ncbi:MAG: hypothetical protein IJX18_03005 [Clostridia bacterium]|nr:hypothetical protein [Clostridia bacterium]
MKVNEMIIAAAELIGDNAATAVKTYLESGAGDEALTNELLRCFNVIEHELAVDFLPIKTEETVETDTGAIVYNALSKKAVQIVKVLDEWGMAVRYDTYGEYLKTRVGKVTVVYTYEPEEKSLGGESDFQRVASKRLFAYGMAAEYCLKAGLYDEAAVWDKKYKEAVEAAYKQSPGKNIRRRLWL